MVNSGTGYMPVAEEMFRIMPLDLKKEDASEQSEIKYTILSYRLRYIKLFEIEQPGCFSNPPLSLPFISKCCAWSVNET